MLRVFLRLSALSLKLIRVPFLSQGGFIDSGSQLFPLLFMALGQRDVSKVQLGELTPYT